MPSFFPTKRHTAKSTVTMPPHQQLKAVTLNGEDHAYEITINDMPLDPEVVIGYAGDVYVHISSNLSQHSIHIHDGTVWFPWDVEGRNKPLELADTIVYPQPSEHRGLVYVSRMPSVDTSGKDALDDIPSIAEIVARDCSYPPLMENEGSRKRVVEGGNSPVSGKRTRRSTVKADQGACGSLRNVSRKRKEPGEAKKSTKGKGKKKAHNGNEAIDEPAESASPWLSKTQTPEVVTMDIDLSNLMPALPLVDVDCAMKETNEKDEMVVESDAAQGAAPDAGEDNELETRECSAHIDRMPTDQHQSNVGYHRLMNWTGPSNQKLRRRLSWPAHDVSTYMPWTGKKVGFSISAIL